MIKYSLIFLAVLGVIIAIAVTTTLFKNIMKVQDRSEIERQQRLSDEDNK